MEIRRSYHQELEEIQQGIVGLAGLVSEMIARGTQILLDADLAAADELIQGDDLIDARSLELEERCAQLIALQQPMAGDLRALLTAIHLVAEIERSADLVVNIAKGTRRIYGAEVDPKLRGLIERMGEKAQRLFRLALDAYADHDASLAAALDDMDDAMDELHADYIQAIFETHAAGTRDLQTAVQLALIGRFFERLADHAVNIGERVTYMVTGWMPEHTGAARLAARQRAEAGDSTGAEQGGAPDGSGGGPTGGGASGEG